MALGREGHGHEGQERNHLLEPKKETPRGTGVSAARGGWLVIWHQWVGVPAELPGS